MVVSSQQRVVRMINMFFWIAFGSITGWTIAIMHKEKGVRRTSTLIGVGAMGGIAGGLAGAALEAQNLEYQTNPGDIMFAVFGATLFVILSALTFNKRPDEPEETRPKQ